MTASSSSSKVDTRVSSHGAHHDSWGLQCAQGRGTQWANPGARAVHSPGVPMPRGSGTQWATTGALRRTVEISDLSGKGRNQQNRGGCPGCPPSGPPHVVMCVRPTSSTPPHGARGHCACLHGFCRCRAHLRGCRVCLRGSWGGLRHSVPMPYTQRGGAIGLTHTEMR